MTVLLAGSYLSRRYVSRLGLGYFGILLLLGFIAIRYGARLFLRTRHRAGKVGRVVIVGNGQVARELATKYRTSSRDAVQSSGIFVSAGCVR